MLLLLSVLLPGCGGCRQAPDKEKTPEDVKANHFDLLGELELTAIDSTLAPLPLRALPFRLSICRDVALSKGQAKGLWIEPAAPQAKRGIVVIAHLAYGFGEAPRPDVNTKNKL